MALHHHLSSFCSLVFVHHAEGELPPPHIQGGIITLQTKHVLLAGQDGLSGEISCRPLCSSWLRILVNCRHRGGHFLLERNLVLSLTSVLLSLVGHLGIPLSSALRALSCQPRVPPEREESCAIWRWQGTDRHCKAGCSSASVLTGHLADPQADPSPMTTEGQGLKLS